MKRKKILLTVLCLAALILEILPNGAVLRFANPFGEPRRQTFSYFSMTPYGYANFGPFFTAILTCVFLILIIAAWFKYSNGLNIVMAVVSGVAVLTSLMPLLYGFDYTVIGAAITILLAGAFGVCFIKDRNRVGR